MGIEKPKIETLERQEKMPALPDTMQENTVATLDNEYKIKGEKVVADAKDMLNAQPSFTA